MVNGSHIIETRSALVAYVLLQLNIDLQKPEAKPEAQQIVVANLAEVTPHVF